MADGNPNWCGDCKGYVIWSVQLEGPWCTCERGAAARKGLGSLLDPLTDVGRAIAKLVDAVRKDLEQSEAARECRRCGFVECACLGGVKR